jgi:iron complex outermembrane recepter protein
MKTHIPRAALLAAALVLRPHLAGAQPVPSPTPSATAEIVVSATKMPEDAVDIAVPVSVVTGDEIRRSGARTVADAIINIVGLDTADGSDSGNRLPNIGMWGLKEFDALLVTVDGVPVGGPFNPSLSQIPVEDVDRMEIAKGPQGTLYGVSAFAGMIQVFTRRSGEKGGSVTVGGGSFSDTHAALAYTLPLANDFTVRAYGSFARSLGWQDRTDYSDTRLTLSGEKKWGDTTLGVSLISTLNTNTFGSPLPVDAGEPVPGFFSEKNYAIRGARLDHRVLALSSSFSTPLAPELKLENTLGLTRDEQIQVRSFIDASDGVTAQATGTALKPVESTVFDDVRLVADFQGAGRHRLVGGAAITWGRTTAAGTGFDFDLTIGPNPIVPELGQVPVGDHRSFSDRRTFFGFYVNDEWTPTPRLTITAGARYDSTSESLAAYGQEVGEPLVSTTDSQTNGAWSGGVAALFRILPKPAGPLETANFYVSAKTAFKPAAPNLSEAESARILDPERTRSGEFGLKTRWLDGTLAFDFSWFHMMFENMVVSILGTDGAPALTNAGEERFQGEELALTYRPKLAEGLTLSGGYAHHDATFVHFSFLTPDGQLRVVDGKRLELVPRDLWNARLGYAPKLGPGGFVAVRHQGQRPLTRRNTFYTPGFFEVDAGLGWEFSWGRLGIYGRNLGDDRHYVSDSEIGDSQFYVSPPRRFMGELTLRF